ncbi:hypothetical protein FACS189490_05170 [Clostridia bacterium]|nr:hypothetical protein FACS189490_05170 [Clostridia bacterium]
MVSNDNYDSADGHASGVMVNLKNLVNESYALEIGRKIHTTKQMNIRNGCFIGSIPPFGYLKSAEDKHKLVPDPITAPIVTKMFEMAASGETVSAIQRFLAENDILPPLKHLLSIGVIPETRARGGNRWNISMIYTILKNRVYTGDMVQGKGRTQSYKVTLTDKTDWIVTPNTHEPLVSREVFEEVQQKFTGEKAPRKSASNDNIFRGKIVCGHCGHAMSRTKSGKTSHTIKCETRFRYGKDDCVQVSINEDKLKGILLEMLKERAALYTLPSTSETKPQQQALSELVTVSAELNRVSGFLKGLYESLVSGDITEPEYRDMKQSYETKIAAFTKRERELRETARERQLQQAAATKVSEHLGAVETITDITAAVIDALIEKITVFEDKRVEVKFTDGISEGSAEK